MKTFADIKTVEKGKDAIHNVGGSKQVKFAGFKVSPSRPTDEQLAKINSFTRRPFTAEELYIGQLRLANNCIDRDKERFSEETLTRFAATALRRTMLFDHNKQSQESAVGKFFDVEVEKVPLQQARMETGEDLQLPAGGTEVWFLSPWFYIPRAGIDEKVIVKIDAAVYDWGSIGFRAKDLVPVMDKDGAILFWEYRGAGPETEMTEGSLVYLGAQYGMSVKTNKSDSSDGSALSDDLKTLSRRGNSAEGGEKTMEKFLKMLGRLFPGKSFTEDGAESEIKAAQDQMIKTAVDAAITPLADRVKALEPLEAKVAELTPLAADGKAYRDGLAQSYVTQKAKLGECAETPEAQDALKKVAAAYPIDFLKSEVGHLEKRVAAKFPAESQLEGGDPEKRDKSAGADKGAKHPLDPNK